ncbi:MAG: hypothetical protein GC150_17545 [Rhizobiales bacterium]|nr:hypothetical protein [Hyphomicrobiales bacterium]
MAQGKSIQPDETVPPAPGKVAVPAPQVGESPRRITRREARRRSAGPSRDQIAANDDAPSIGGLIFALNQRPSSQPFYFAAVATAVWIVVGGLLGWSFMASEFRAAGSLAAIAARPEAIAVATAVLLPVALFWFLAVLIWRAQELRLMSSAMTEVAVRLAEPDRLAEQSVTSLGQTVRRQVGAMNDAISRALGRAGELEALVHSEVAALERYYSENELRIRGLIEELASEREALGNNSERVSELLHGIGQRVSRDIVTASDQAARNLANSTAQLSSEIERAGNQLNVVLQESSERTAHIVSERGNTLLTSLNSINQRITAEIPDLLDRLGGEQVRLARIVEGAGKNLAALETALAERTGSLETGLGERTRHLETVLSEYTEAVDRTMAEHTRTFHDTLSARLGAIDAKLGDHVGQVENALADRVQALGRQLAETRAQFVAAFSEGTRRLDEDITSKARALDAALGEKMETFDGSLSARAQQLFDTLDGRGTEIEQAIIDRTKLLDRAFAERIQHLEMTVTKGASALDEALGQKARALRDALQAHGQTIRTSLEQQAEHLDSNLARGIEAVRRSSQEITHQSIATIEGLATQSRSLREISHGVLNQINELSRRFENQSHAIGRTASTLEEIERLKTVTANETDRTLAELRHRFSNVSDEVSLRLAELTSKVTESTDEVRRRTERATNEIEETRSRLISEASTLPGVARESAGAMRDALKEQLRALDTLSSFANRQSGQRDILTGPSGAKPAPTIDARPAGSAPFATAAVGGTPATQSGGQRTLTQSQSQASTPLTTSPATSSSALLAGKSQPASGDGGWSLGDLLARASDPDGTARDDDGMDVSTASGGIDIEAIARALDDQTSRELWSDLRRGQWRRPGPEVYTPRARRAFEQVQRRYLVEGSFRTTVDRYLMDFDRIMREFTDRKDEQGLQALTTSNPGRVYLLLAHASGRLG